MAHQRGYDDRAKAGGIVRANPLGPEHLRGVIEGGVIGRTPWKPVSSHNTQIGISVTSGDAEQSMPAAESRGRCPVSGGRRFERHRKSVHYLPIGVWFKPSHASGTDTELKEPRRPIVIIENQGDGFIAAESRAGKEDARRAHISR